MTKTKILIVENDDIIAQSLQFTLIHLGYEIVGRVAQGRQAIQFVNERPVDIILMDIGLDGQIDGIETARIIQSHMLYIPIIYLTSHTDEYTLRRACPTQPFGYIFKPFKERELQICIEIALYKHQAELKLRESEARLITILKSIADPVLILDRRGIIIFSNFLAEVFLHTPYENLINQKFETLFTIDFLQDATRSLIAQAMQKAMVITLPDTAQIRTASHTIPIGQTLISPIIYANEEIDGVVITLKQPQKTHV